MSAAFRHGPADGVTLSFEREPLFLRVVQNTAGEWDVLDQVDDTPELDETIHVYRKHGEPMRGFWDGAGKGGVFSLQVYHHHPEQPTDAQARETRAWQQWCREQATTP